MGCSTNDLLKPVFFFREFSQAASDLFGKISEASRDSATHAATRHWRKNASSGRIFQNPLRSMPAKKYLISDRRSHHEQKKY